MNLLPTPLLEFYINKKTNESKWGAFFIVIMFAFFSVAFYCKSSTIVFLIINNIVVAAISCACIYSIVFMEAMNINSIIKEIEIGNNLVIVTYGYSFLFFRLSPIRTLFDRENFFFEEAEFPFNSNGLKKDKTICIHNIEAKYYLLYECYDENVKEKLRLFSESNLES